MKIAHIVGNRPQFIKLALLSKAIRQVDGAEEIVIHTGQHFHHNMSDVFFEQLPLPKPDVVLNINNLPHAAMIGRMLESLSGLLAKEKPTCVIVYGDTNTTLAGALAAKKAGIPVVHIEAGVRTYDERMPEETNRYLTDRMADLNFACTYLGMENLQSEGFFAGWINSKVYNTGDLMLDAAMQFKEEAAHRSSFLPDHNMIGKKFVLATIHRAENVNDKYKLQQIAGAINDINEQAPVIFPVHPNTRNIINDYGIDFRCTLTYPLGYLDTLALVQQAHAVITDSGGLSREAFFFSKPAIVLMDKPFWPEIFLHGPCLQSGTNNIIEQWQRLFNINKSSAVHIFGDGKAAQKISDILFQSFK